MGSETPSIPTNVPQETSNSDEYFLQHSLVFAESLKDLKNLRVQLYSAAEYFESSYEKHEYKQLVVETLKDYASKALISTVDHLGSVAYKVGSFLDKKVNEMSATRLQFSCLEQRLRTCRGYTDRNGLLQQSLVIKTPRHYKHYTVPVADGKFTRKFDSKQGNVCFLNPHDDKPSSKKQADDCRLEKFQGAVAKPRPTLMRGRSEPPPSELSPRPLSFSFVKVTSDKEVGKRTASPFRLPLKRSGSVANRSTSPNSSAAQQRCPSETPRASSMSTNPDRNKGKEIELYSRKSKHPFRALLSIHRSRKQAGGARTTAMHIQG
ncbi:protein ABIL2-like isoform X3 [Coffea eugenioides]|uniref:Protein ABIL2-like isoform X3 n=1 Tax=Coffea arabica TaxID=13443 RepID=A0A6P6TUA1_COFAR|nr:protein ABIL2-like isoform X3 [Coffea arabica]XP_027181039.1 protein ABIL2-like isoform X3 [Coffea eugenioides]